MVLGAVAGSPPGWRAPAPKSEMIPAMIAPSSGRKTIAVYTAQPFIMLMSSTAIVPRLR